MSLQRVKKEHKRRAAMTEIEEIPRPDLSQARKAYVYMDFNYGWVGGRKQLITGYDKSETDLSMGGWVGENNRSLDTKNLRLNSHFAN